MGFKLTTEWESQKIRVECVERVPVVFDLFLTVTASPPGYTVPCGVTVEIRKQLDPSTSKISRFDETTRDPIRNVA